MTDVQQLIDALGGYAHKTSLVAGGARDLDLTIAVRSGRVTRVRRGWYSTRDMSSSAAQALRIGGRLTGLSAVAEWGGWVLRTRILHVSVPDNAARLRTSRAPHRLHWDSPEVGFRGTVTSVALVDALVRVVLDEDLETAVAALDWAQHVGRLEVIDFERMLLRLPCGRRWIRDWIDPSCESLPESLSRTRLRMAGYSVVSQVPLGRERIDLVINRVIGLETDGDEYHRDSFERDRRKDLSIARSGYQPLRASARAVFTEWHAVAEAIERLVLLNPSDSSSHLRRAGE